MSQLLNIGGGSNLALAASSYRVDSLNSRIYFGDRYLSQTPEAQSVVMVHEAIHFLYHDKHVSIARALNLIQEDEDVDEDRASHLIDVWLFAGCPPPSQ